MERDQIIQEIKNTRMPLYVRAFYKLWFSFLKQVYIFIIASVFIVGGVFVLFWPDTVAYKYVSNFFILPMFALGFLCSTWAVTASVIKNNIILKKCKKFGITVDEWDAIIEVYKIKINY